MNTKTITPSMCATSSPTKPSRSSQSSMRTRSHRPSGCATASHCMPPPIIWRRRPRTEIQRIRQTAAGQELILLIGDEQLVRTAKLSMQIEAVRELLHTTARLESVESRTALLELARTVTDLCGMEDALTANGDEAVHRMEQVWELFRGAVSAEHAERRQALLEEADIQMDELCGCLNPEAEVEDGKQLLTWEELRSELETVARALEASDQGAVPR